MPNCKRLAAVALVFLFLLSAFFCPNSNAKTGDWSTQTFTGAVRAITFDDTLIWLATGGGAVRVTPSDRRAVFTRSEGLSGIEVTSAVVDANHDVWFGVNGGGLSRRRHDNGSWRTFTMLDGLAGERVSTLVIHENTLWVGTEDGLSVFRWSFDSDEGRHTFLFSDAYRASRGVPVGPVNDLTLDTSGIWVATENGLSFAPHTAINLKDPSTWIRYTPSDGLPDEQITCVATDGQEVWAGTRSGAARLEGSAFTVHNTGLPSSDIRDLVFINGALWTATSLEVARFDGVAWSSVGGGAGAGGARTIAQSPEGAIWLGSAQSGFARLEQGQWSFRNIEGPAGQTPASVFVRSDGHLIAGFNEGGSGRFDGTVWSSYNTSDGLASGSISMIGQNPDGTLWFGSFGGGLSRLDDQGTSDKNDDVWELFNHNNSVFEGIPGDHDFVVVNAWAMDHTGGQWFANFDVGAHYLSPSGVWTTFRPRAGELSSARIRSIAVSADSSVWFATDNRLSRYVPALQTWRIYGAADGLPSPQVNAVAASVTGDVWAATDAGLARISPDGSLIPIGLPAGLNTGQATALATDARGLVWVGSPSGLARLNPELFDWLVFTPDNSPLASPLILSIAVQKETGVVWIGTGNGVNRYESGVLPLRITLTDVPVYPNPFIPSRGDREVIFGQLADGSQVSILTVDGLLVRQIAASQIIAQQIAWDGRNERGQPVTGGVYLFIVTAPDGSHRAGKIAVIR